MKWITSGCFVGMVWGTLSPWRKDVLLQINTTNQYKGILTDHFCPVMRHFYLEGSCLSQNDNTAIHREQVFTEYKYNASHMLWFCSRQISTQLNIYEKFWTSEMLSRVWIFVCKNNIQGLYLYTLCSIVRSIFNSFMAINLTSFHLLNTNMIVPECFHLCITLIWGVLFKITRKCCHSAANTKPLKPGGSTPPLQFFISVPGNTAYPTAPLTGTLASTSPPLSLSPTVEPSA